MVTNLFRISHRICLEDKFTSSLSYLLNKYPLVGQGFLDRICDLSGERSKKFLHAEVHPAATANDRPDMLIVADGLKILCEHKIESMLGPTQLERYLKYAKANGQKLALFSGRMHSIPLAVLEDKQYIRPKSIQRDLFAWSDFYDFFRSFRYELVQDFSAWIDEDLGFNPNIWPGHEDPFFSEIAQDQFADCLSDLKVSIQNIFGKIRGQMFKLAENGTAMEMRKVLPDVHLAFLFITRAPTDREGNLLCEPTIGINIWTKKQELFSTEHGKFQNQYGEISYFYRESVVASWNKELHSPRIYFMPLRKILLNSDLETKKRIESFVTDSLKHCLLTKKI